MAEGRHHECATGLRYAPNCLDRNGKIGHQMQHIGHDDSVKLASRIRKRIDIGLLASHIAEPVTLNSLFQRIGQQSGGSAERNAIDSLSGDH